MVRCHVTLEKSSKNYISLFGGKPARGLPTLPLTSTRAVTAHFPRVGRQVRTASANSKCEIYLRESLAGGGRRGVWFAKRCHSITDHRIDCKLKMKIANSNLLLCYLNKICIILTGGLWQASANLYSGGRLKREPEPVASPQSTILHSTVQASPFWRKEVSHSNTRGTVRLCSFPLKLLLHIVYIFNILCGLEVIISRRLQ